MQTKIDIIRAAGEELELADNETTPLAWDLLDRLCLEWGCPRYHELGRYQLKPGGASQGGYSVWLRDKDTGIVITASGSSDLGARISALRTIREVLASENRDVCFPKTGSQHSPLCTCSASGRDDAEWTDDDYSFERIFDLS